jgi:hypothetical protein
VACRLALEALPDLPSDTAQALREPIQALCAITERELDWVNPHWREVSADRSLIEKPQGS